MPRPPEVLFARGRPLSGRPAVAVVGARRASRSGLEAAGLIARDLARAGVVVVSGFARGIDAAAHRAALQAGGETVAVFGCGLDVCYPPEHEALLADLLSNGTALSEFPMGTKPLPYYFPVRNRIIAGLVRIVCVVEAAERSGSLITARYAAEFGRDVAAVPGSVLAPGAAGSNALLKDGAILVRGAADLLTELPAADRARLKVPAAVGEGGARDPTAGLDGDSAAVFAALHPDDPRDPDALLQATGLTAARLSAALVRLELEGLATALPGAVFVRRRDRT
jgi:DNA processing protein